MRENSSLYGSGSLLHWHDGYTCMGDPTLEKCIDGSIKAGWTGRVLRKDDVYRDGTKVSCFSLITGHFDHHGKNGVYVAVIELKARLL